MIHFLVSPYWVREGGGEENINHGAQKSRKPFVCSQNMEDCRTRVLYTRVCTSTYHMYAAVPRNSLPNSVSYPCH